MKDNTYDIRLKCANCETDLKPVFVDMPGANPELALHLTMHGGYGMYYDAGDLSMYLCFSCATDFLAKFPNLNKRFQEHLVQYDSCFIRYDSKGVEDSESTET